MKRVNVCFYYFDRYNIFLAFIIFQLWTLVGLLFCFVTFSPWTFHTLSKHRLDAEIERAPKVGWFTNELFLRGLGEFLHIEEKLIFSLGKHKSSLHLEGRSIKESLLFQLSVNCWQNALWSLKRIINCRAKKESAIRKWPIKWARLGERVVAGGWWLHRAQWDYWDPGR